jgi:hypothetical protein
MVKSKKSEVIAWCKHRKYSSFFSFVDHFNWIPVCYQLLNNTIRDIRDNERVSVSLNLKVIFCDSIALSYLSEYFY